MSTKTDRSHFGLKLGLLLLVALGLVGYFVFMSRATAKVAVVTKGRAVNAVPGTLVIRAAYEEPLVPRRAVFGNGIYVVEDGRVKRRKVELGYVSLNIVEVTKGLKAGEVVIVDDIDKYREGDRVNTEVVK